MNKKTRLYALAIAGVGLLTVIGGCRDGEGNLALAGGPEHTQQPSSSPSSSTSPSDQPVPSTSATPSTSPTPSTTTPRPTRSTSAPTPTTTRAPGTAKPDASNTGVVAGTALTIVNGNQTFSTSGQVIEGKDFRGYVKVTGSNITFRNCIFHGGTPSGNNALLNTQGGSTNTVVEDSEFVPLHPAATIDGIWAANTSFYRINVHGSVDGMKTFNNTLVQDSYIHDMSWFASDPNQGGGPTHNDGVQAYPGGVTLRHNNIDLSTTKDGNAALQSSSADSVIDDNWLDGGGCTLNFNGQGHTLPNVAVTNNRFGRHSFYQCPILLSTTVSLAKNTGNVWVDTGTAIPSPQQHD